MTNFTPTAALNIEKLRKEELEEARAVQRLMFPFGSSVSARGDFLDYFEMSDGTIGLSLGDVPERVCLPALTVEYTRPENPQPRCWRP